MYLADQMEWIVPILTLLEIGLILILTVTEIKHMRMAKKQMDFMERDTKARENIFSKVVDLQRALSRREFFQIALRVFEKAEKEVCFVSYTLASKVEEPDQCFFHEKINEFIKKGGNVRLITVRDITHLPGAYEYKQAGASLRFNVEVSRFDHMFILNDKGNGGLGFRRNGRTEIGYEVPSNQLCSTLWERFNNLWSNSEEYNKFLQYIIDNRKKEIPQMPIEQMKQRIATNLKISFEEVNRFLNKTKTDS